MALQQSGQWDQAMLRTLQALHDARTRFPTDRDLQRQIATQCMEILSRRDPVLLDTLFYETRALLPAVSQIPKNFC